MRAKLVFFSYFWPSASAGTQDCLYLSFFLLIIQRSLCLNVIIYRKVKFKREKNHWSEWIYVNESFGQYRDTNTLLKMIFCLAWYVVYVCVCVCANRKKVDQQKEELDRLKAVLDSKEDMEKKQAGELPCVCGSPSELVVWYTPSVGHHHSIRLRFRAPSVLVVRCTPSVGYRHAAF